MTGVRRLIPYLVTAWLALGTATSAGSAEREAPRELVEAARVGDVEAVRRLLEQGAPPDRTSGRTPLAAALALKKDGAGELDRKGEERLEIMRLLLTAGANVNRNTGGGTALESAAYFVDLEAVRLLLEAGADPNLADRWGLTPLLASLTVIPREEDGQLELIRLLLARGADVNVVRRMNGSTPLFDAVQRGGTGTKLTELLLSYGADPNARDGTGAIALGYAVQGVHRPSAADMVLVLVKAGADVNARDRAGRSIAVIAASTGNQAMLPLLGKLGATDAKEQIARTAFDARTALLQAAERPQLGLVRLLLAGGADPNVQDDRGWTPLIHAAGHGRTDVVEALLAHGARVNATTKTGSTALMLAAGGWHLDTTRALVAAGANVNVKDKAGNTPLLIASRSERVVRAGRTAPTFPVPSQMGGTTSGGTVEQAEVPGVSGMTRERIPDQEPALVAVLLAAGANPNAQDRDGLTALMYAASQGRVELVKLLLAHGADVQVKNARGDTAWTLATGEEVVRALREARKR